MSEIDVSVVCAWPGEVWQQRLRVPEGSTVGTVLARVPWQAVAGPDAGTLKTGIFGRLVGPDEVLRPGDRIELYRPLQIDPKQVRRERAGHGRSPPVGRR